MAAFMHHGGHIAHLTGCIHKNKWCTTFCKRAVVSTGSLAHPAFQVKVFELVHLAKAVCKEWIQLLKTGFLFWPTTLFLFQKDAKV